MAKTTLRIAVLLIASLALALGMLPYSARADDAGTADEELESVYLVVPLNQGGNEAFLHTNAYMAQDDSDAILIEDPQARAYPVDGSKEELLRGRLHTQLTAMVETINVRDLHIKRDSIDIGPFYADVVNSDPDLFYVTTGLIARYNTNKNSPTYGEIAEISPAANTTRSDTGKITITQSYAFTASQAAAMKSSYESAIQDALSWIPTNATSQQAAKAIHDWLLDHCSYNYAAEASSGPTAYGSWEPWTAYSGLVTGTPVCQGYSLAFLACMNRAGIPATYVTDHPEPGEAKHGWNRVQIGNDWYNLDITFDDTSSKGDAYYFVKSDTWWKNNPGPGGYHTEWYPVGEPGTNTRFDNTTWSRYTGPGSSPAAVTSFTLNRPSTSTMSFDGTLDFAIDTFQPADANIGFAAWTSSNPSVATIDNAGLASAGTRPGTATITCKLGSAARTCTIKVLGDLSDGAFDFRLNQTEFNYTGTSQTPVLEQHLLHVDSGDLVLEEGIDYTISWPTDTTSVGTKTVTVKGIGLYTGTRTLTYHIVANDTSALKAALARAKEEQPSAIASATGADVPKNKLWVPTRVAQDLQQAMDAAQKVLAKKQATAQEIDNATRALGKATEAYIAAKKPGTKPATWKRLSGPIALDTMAAIAREGWVSSKVAILATSEGFWDALSASALAGQYNAPVLMTETARLSAQTRSELQRLKPATVYICGGPKAISPAVQQQVSALGIKVVRVAGETAVGTACKIADALTNPGTTCIVATLETYQDALSISPYAFARTTPIYLCDQAGLSDQTKASIAAHGFTSAVIVGGPVAVPASVETQLASLGCTFTTRLGGANAYETSSLTATWELSQGMQANRLAIATCTGGYWDALAGAALCGKNQAVLVLADDANRTTINGFVHGHSMQILQGYAYGGPAAVSEATFTAAKQAAG